VGADVTDDPQPAFSIADVAATAVRNMRNPLLLYGVAETALLGVLLATGANVPTGLYPVVFAVTGLIPFVAVCHFVMEYRMVSSRVESVTTDQSVSNPKSINVYAASDSSQFRDEVEGHILRARHVRLIGAGINIIQRDQFTRELIGRVTAGDCELEIYLADPLSPWVQTRLAEEELGSYKPPVGRKGLENRIQTLLAAWRSAGRPASMQIRLFSHYPTMAMLLIDDDYFFYPYGFATLGNFSPVLHLRRTDPDNYGYTSFLDQQYQLVREHSIDAETVVGQRARPPATADRLVPFALYLVPPADSALYRVGSAILGYDVRARRLSSPAWADAVGSAAAFGLHVTVADALYFNNEREVAAVVADLELACKDFTPFDLTNFRLCERIPSERCLSMLFDDRSGTLEALHHEAVARANRVAVASDYSMGHAPVDRDVDHQRARTMIRHYRAPYVLGRYRPHLSLASDVPPERLGELRDEFQRLVDRALPEPSLHVTHLCVMARDAAAASWYIAREIPLGW
jgi:Protein of unknown function (DUF1045)